MKAVLRLLGGALGGVHLEEAAHRGADVVHVLHGHAVVAAEQEAVAHDLVRVGVVIEVLSVDGVPRDVAGEGDARLDVVLLEEAEQAQALARGALEGNRQPVHTRVRATC
jgi:hypothetical protein